MPAEIQYFLINAAAEKEWTDYAFGISSILIAIIALCTSIYQSILSRNHNKITVRPHLATHVEQEEGLFKMEIRNDGVGPAIITSAKLLFEGIEVEGKGSQLIENALKKVPHCNIECVGFFTPVFVLPQGGTVEVATISHSKDIENLSEHLEQYLQLEIEYQSVYGEKSRLSTLDD
ncbi:hypothetical protein [Pseudomonas protegens]|uniref:hypothetical protein n=1 Tax=Pseudomonas protegens TaxID=380021 RepID=UPI0011AF8E6D|nr:hypothetical protein [Pseudomonas protegens]